MNIEELKQELKSMDYGWENQFGYPDALIPQQIDELLEELSGFNDSIIDNMTDTVIFEVEVEIEGDKFVVCGDIYCGTFSFMKEEV